MRIQYVRFSEIFHFHDHQNKHGLGQFQYYMNVLNNNRIKCIAKFSNTKPDCGANEARTTFIPNFIN